MKISIELSAISREKRIKLAKSISDMDTLKTLAQDEDYLVRVAVAQNPNATPEILLKLSKDEVWVVRSGVAENANVTDQVLQIILRDSNKDVAMAAFKSYRRGN